MEAVEAQDKPAPQPGAEKPKMGRPTRYTPELWAELIDRMSEGEPLQQICRDAHMPSVRAVHSWTEPDCRLEGIPETLAADFARAREIGHDFIAADCLRIADDDSRDWTPVKDADGNVIGIKVDGEHVSRSKLRIETRQNLLAKWDKRYSNKMEHTGPGGGPLIVQAVALDEKL